MVFWGDALTIHLIPTTLTGRFWDPQNSKSLSLGSPGSPITKMVAVAGKLWCGCQNRVIVLNTTTLAQEVRRAMAGGRGDGGTVLGIGGIISGIAVALCHLQHTLQVGQDGGRSVTCMVSAGTGVWVALQSSAQVRLYHATSYEQLAEADITPPVHKMLAGKSHRWQVSGGCPSPSRMPISHAFENAMSRSIQHWKTEYLLHPHQIQGRRPSLWRSWGSSSVLHSCIIPLGNSVHG